MAFKKFLRKIGFWLGMLFFAAFAVFPTVWMLISSFKENNDLYNVANNPFLFNLPPTLKHVKFLFTNTEFSVFLWNSVLIGVMVVIITLLLAVPAAYSLSRLVGRWGERSGIAVFLVYLIPPTLLFIPLYQVMSLVHAANTIWALVLVYPTITVPFCTWLLLGFFKSMPREMEEAALIDGYSRWQAFLRVSLPMAWPGVATCVVFAFALSLSDYIYAASFVSETASRPINSGVPTALMRGDIYFWQSLMAAAAIVTIPLAIGYGLLFDKLIQGFQPEAKN